MSPKCNLAIIGTPRSASSALAKILVSEGWSVPQFGNSPDMSPSKFNTDGYFESTFLNLMNDQIIRARFGMIYSFLFPPEFSDIKDSGISDDFFFDLDAQSLDIPSDYLESIRLYTGEDWDVWGLTRMLQGGKWHKAYSTRSLATGISLKNSIVDFNQYLASEKGFVMKDSRLTFTLDLFSNNIDKVIVLSREDSGLTASIRNHYGQNIFTSRTCDPFPWVSNHFNYKIQPMTFDSYADRYISFSKALTKNKEVLFLDQSDLRSENYLTPLLEFIHS
jgi:hypothetical protein